MKLSRTALLLKHVFLENRRHNVIAWPGSSAIREKLGKAGAATLGRALSDLLDSGQFEIRWVPGAEELLLPDADAPPDPPSDPWVAACEFLAPGSPLRGPRFEAAWREWCSARSVTKVSLPRQLRFLDKMGVDGAIATIENSLTNNYKGLIKPGDRRANTAKESLTRVR